MTGHFSTPAALRLAWCLVHFIWQGVLLGLLAWAVLAALRGRNPRLRYGAACAFLGLCALVPLCTFFLLIPPTDAPMGSHAPMLLGLDPASSPAFPEPLLSSAVSWRARLLPWLPVLLVGWMLGTLVLGLRAAGAWLWLQHLRRSALPVLEEPWAERVRELAIQAGIRRPVQLLQGLRVRSPMALGLLRPVILVPLGFFTQVDAAGAEAVLAHELAHLRRLDPLMNGLQCLLETLLFFHPAVHFISRCVRTERECCCDDEAVRACGDAVLYVETLCRLDALREGPLSLALSARGGNLVERITRLLAPAPAPRLAVPALAVALLAVSATALLAQAPKKAAQMPATPAAEAPQAAVRPEALRPVVAADPWGDKGEHTPVQIEAKTLKEAIRKFAELRRLDPVIGGTIPDREGPFTFRHAPWRAALDSLVKSQGLICLIQDGVLRVAQPHELQSEAQWARQLAPRAELPAPPAAAAPSAEPKAPQPAPTVVYVPSRRVQFTLRQGKDGVAKLKIEARRATREELLEALRKIEHLAKAGIDGERPLQGEWTLPALKEEGAQNLLSFELDGVTTQSVRELYK